MPAKRPKPEFTRKEAFELLSDYPRLVQFVRESGGRQPASFRLGVSRNTVKRYLNDPTAAIKKSTQPPRPGVEQQVEEARRKAQEKAAKRELRDLVNKRAQIEAIRDAIRDAGLRATIPPLLSHLPTGGPYDEEYPILVLSDWHIGQLTDPVVNAGFGVNLETARRQVECLIRTLMRLWEIQHQVTPWRHLTILGLGDWVEGALRPAQHRQAAAVAPQAIMAGIALAMVLREALKFFQTVTFKAVPGNHGRVSSRPGVAGLDEVDPINSWDWIAVEYARGILGVLEGDSVVTPKRLTIDNHATFIARTQVAGWTIVFEHGAEIRGGAYGGVPFYPVDRAAKNTRTMLAPVDVEWDDDTSRYLRTVGDYYLFILGHFHRPTILPQSFGWVVMNGSLPPTTPFVTATQHQALTPVQWLLSLHPKKGLTMARPIYLHLPEWQGLQEHVPIPPRFGGDAA